MRLPCHRGRPAAAPRHADQSARRHRRRSLSGALCMRGTPPGVWWVSPKAVRDIRRGSCLSTDSYPNSTGRFEQEDHTAVDRSVRSPPLLRRGASQSDHSYTPRGPPPTAHSRTSTAAAMPFDFIHSCVHTAPSKNRAVVVEEGTVASRPKYKPGRVRQRTLRPHYTQRRDPPLPVTPNQLVRQLEPFSDWHVRPHCTLTWCPRMLCSRNCS